MESENFNNVLKSYLNFNFERDTKPVLANRMIPVYYESGDWKKTDSSLENWYDYYNEKWANAITYNHNLVYNQVENDSDLKIFNGTSDYVSLGSAGYEFGKSLTVVARVKVYEYSSSASVIVGNLEQAGFYINKKANNQFGFHIYDSNNSKYITLSSSFTLELDTWYTIVGTFDGTTIKLYIDGVLEDSVALSGSIPTSEAPIVIGANPKTDGTVSGSYFNGAISEVIIMTETLTENEIVQKYGNTIIHTPSRANVLYYYKFNGDNGIVCNGASYQSEGMLFDGIDDYVSVGYTMYDFNNTFTVAARVKFNAYSDTSSSIVGDPQNAGFSLSKIASNKFRISAYDEDNSQYQRLDSNTTVELDTWYTVVATYDGSKLCLYINGQLDNSLAVVMNLKVSKVPFMIGVNPTAKSSLGGAYLNGVISDVMIVDEALTASQISTYYSSDLRTVISDKTLISYDLRAYEGREDGTVIPEEMISTMWVWRPRFSATIPTSADTIDLKLVGVDEDAHDAFTFGQDELEGFWIGKYENGTNFTSETANNTILIKANNSSWTGNSIGAMYSTIKNIALLPDEYGFDSSDTKSLDTHMIKNNEWGAVAYLAQSKFGNLSGTVQSTTGDEYGVYDMEGGTSEFVMANYNNTTNSYFEALPDTKYYNVYTTQDAYTNNKLQHALFETNEFYNTGNQNFVDSTNMWLVRDGLFSYSNSTGVGSTTTGSRSVLIVK